jgi:hypothetical protein
VRALWLNNDNEELREGPPVMTIPTLLELPAALGDLMEGDL